MNKAYLPVHCSFHRITLQVHWKWQHGMIPPAESSEKQQLPLYKSIKGFWMT